MIILTREQRVVLSDKVPDAANLAPGALFFGQLLGERPFSTRLALFGFGTWLVLLGLALHFARGESP